MDTIDFLLVIMKLSRHLILTFMHRAMLGAVFYTVLCRLYC